MEQQIYEQLSFIKMPINDFLVDNFSANDFCPDQARKEIKKNIQKFLI